MKKLFCTLLVLPFLWSCHKEDAQPYSYEQSTIYSETNTTNFSTIVLELKPYVMQTGVKKYLVNATLKNVALRVDNFDFGSHNSLFIDTTLVTKQVANNYVVTGEDIKYPVLVPFETKNDPVNTAGQYAELLNNRVVIGPGFYICKIMSFELTRADGSVQKVYTNIYQSFEVKSGLPNCYLGTFEILIK